MKKDVVIIGGGASGLFTALHIADDISVCIIDSAPLGKKLLVTGNGRANLTNTDISNKYYNKDLDKYFDRFNATDTIKLFAKLGLLTYADDEGRVYPITNTATSVQDVLTSKIISNNNIEYIRNKVATVSPIENGYLITLDNEQSIECTYCVVACGGNAKINLPLEISIQEFTPALCSLETTPNTGLNGIRVHPATVSLFVDNNNIYSEQGEILFKENGISGIVIMNISNHLPKDVQNTHLIIDLLPTYTNEKLFDILVDIIQNNHHLLVGQICNGILHKSLASNVLSRAKLHFNDKASNLSHTKLKEIVFQIKNYYVKVIGRLQNNQIYLGGVALNDLNYELEHKKASNLYFAGEFTEVAGHCGGFNLQWAFTSGAIIGKSISSKKD